MTPVPDLETSYGMARELKKVECGSTCPTLFVGLSDGSWWTGMLRAWNSEKDWFSTGPWLE